MATLRRQSAEGLHSNWRQLADRYLPVTNHESIWRYSRQAMPGDPEQGWKLHVSATILKAADTLKAIAPFLAERDALFKAPCSLVELSKLNTGVFYGYSQVGKFITIYPQTTEEAVFLAGELYRLTRRFTAPAVPFDLKYRNDGCVYYRYGAFNPLDFEAGNGERVPALKDPDGKLVRDVRDSISQPTWVSDPFVQSTAAAAVNGQPEVPTPLKTTFRAFRALGQRGKGGVYQALDLSAKFPRLCVLKEGRRNGEIDWDGRDGFWRIKHERRVLTLLRKAGIDVPLVYSSFVAAQNFYLAAEFIDGEDLRHWLEKKQRRISINAALKLSAELASLVASIHAAGWVWRDCKPGNIILTKQKKLRPVDLEGACPIDRPDPATWGTTSYVPPEANDPFHGQSRLPEDLYALGAVMFYLLTGRTPDLEPPRGLTELRTGIPSAARDVVSELLDPDPQRRPPAQRAAERLNAISAVR